MSVDPIAVFLGVLGVVLTLLVHTGALFYWGGKITQTVRDHERRLEEAEKASKEILNNQKEMTELLVTLKGGR